MTMSNDVKGVLWMLSHCFYVALTMVIVRHLSVDLSSGQILFFQNLFAVLMVVPWIIYKGGVQTHTEHFKLHLLRAFIGTVSMGIYFFVLTKIPLTQARAIALSEPLVTSILAIFILKETVGIHRISAIVIGMMGALIVLSPGNSHHAFSAYTLLAFVPVVMWGFSNVIIKKLSATEASTTQLLYLTTLMTALSLPYALLDWKSDLDIRLLMWTAGLGVIFALNVVAIFMAFKLAEVNVVMPFDFSGMIFTAILAFVIFGEVLTLNTIIGATIIVAGSIYVLHRESLHRKARLAGGGIPKKPWYRFKILSR